MKQLFTFLLALLVSSGAMAETQSGNTDNYSWTLDDNGLLTITGTGTGELSSFSEMSDAGFKSAIKSLVISAGITSIADNVFSGCTNLKSVELHSIPLTASEAFTGCSALETKTLALTDDSYIYTESNNFPTLTSAPTYTRSMANKWGTIVLPFAITVTGEEANYDFYELSSISEDETTLNLTKKNGDIAAGTPLLIRMSETAKNAVTNKYDLSLTANSTSVSTTLQTGSSAGSLRLTGAFTETDITDKDGYIIAYNAFWYIADVKGENKVYCAPFRAYLAGTDPGAKTLNISTEDETAISVINSITEGAAEYYDLNGRRIADLQKGVNIVKYNNGLTKKIIVK